MADGRSSKVLDQYWKALHNGRREEAARLKAELSEQYQAVLKAFDLLDELLDVRDMISEEAAQESLQESAEDISRRTQSSDGQIPPA